MKLITSFNLKVSSIYSILLLYGYCSLISCKVKPTVDGLSFAKNNFVTSNTNCIDSLVQGIDSKANGYLICGDETYYYDYGKYANKGPTDMLTNFTQTFATYHHSKFFHELGMEERLFGALKDKVSIVSVMPIHVALQDHAKSSELMWECPTCNSVAQLIFEGHTFYFPYTESVEVMGVKRDTFVVGTYNHIIFSSILDRTSGLIIIPQDYKRGQSDVLSIINKNVKNRTQVNTTLRSIIAHQSSKRRS